jgi:hypothetical protein
MERRFSRNARGGLVIEFLLGFAASLLVRAVGDRLLDDRAAELEDENRMLREVLRRVRLLVRAQRPDSFIGGYIDHVLGDEAGA